MRCYSIVIHYSLLSPIFGAYQLVGKPALEGSTYPGLKLINYFHLLSHE